MTGESREEIERWAESTARFVCDPPVWAMDVQELESHRRERAERMMSGGRGGLSALVSLTRPPVPLPDDWLVDAWMPGLFRERQVRRYALEFRGMARQVTEALMESPPTRMERGKLYDAYIWDGREVPKFWR